MIKVKYVTKKEESPIAAIDVGRCGWHLLTGAQIKWGVVRTSLHLRLAQLPLCSDSP